MGPRRAPLPKYPTQSGRSCSPRLTYVISFRDSRTLPYPTVRQGLDEPRWLPKAEGGVDLTPAPGAKWWAGAVTGCTAVLYVIFW